MLDTHRSIETPEGVELGLRVAGPVPRALALGLDVAIRIAAYTLLAMPLALLGGAGMGLWLIVLFCGEWLYPVFFEVLRDGSTPGKRRLGLQVLHDDGTPIAWSASMIRNLLRFVDFLPAVYAFGLTTMLFHRDFKRLGDLAAGTLVVHRDDAGARSRVPKAEALPPAVPLGLDEQRAILEFAERRPSWTRERAAELAGLARPLTGKPGLDGAEALTGIANWLVGRR